MTNYFGMVLSFMAPGIVIGLLAAGAAREIAESRRAKNVRTSPQRKLYIEDLKKGGV